MSDFNYETVEAEMWEEEEEEQANSVLLSLVQSYDWPGALSRIFSNPSEAEAVGIQGRTPLHVACDHDAPAVVVQSLLKAYPQASAMVGTSNMNPLHITCSSNHASVHVVRVLLDGGLPVQTSMRDVDGDTPLHAACRCGAPIEVLEVLLWSYPGAVHERDYEGLTPLLRLWVRYFVMLGDDQIEAVKGLNDLVGELGEAWKKTELLLRCAYHGSLYHGHKRPFRAVHAAAAFDCPRAVLKIATRIHPEQLTEKDENGLTPLLIAVQTPIFKVRDLSDDGYMIEDRIHGDDTNCDVNKHDDENDISPGSSVIDVLLSASAAAARIPNPQGKLPLHLAISNGKRWNQGVKAILSVFPDALGIYDPQTRLVPFMLAAVGDTSDCLTVMELLRDNPALVNGAIRDSRQANISALGNGAR